jgi:hypothetical protein
MQAQAFPKNRGNKKANMKSVREIFPKSAFPNLALPDADPENQSAWKTGLNFSTQIQFRRKGLEKSEKNQTSGNRIVFQRSKHTKKRIPANRVPVRPV